MAKKLDPKGKRTLGVLTKVQFKRDLSYLFPRLISWIKEQMLKI